MNSRQAFNGWTDAGLRRAFNDWLARHFDPIHTATGTVSKSRGVTRYEGDTRLRLLLGGAIVTPAHSFRSGDDVPYRVKRAIEEIVELQDPKKIRILRRDQSVKQNLKHGVRHQKTFGQAPDGGRLAEWAEAILERENERFGVTGRPNVDLWNAVAGRPESANEIRKIRYRDAV